jgi:ornithine cyclodeaminase/alanine dehydrogenase-like protein (mu-crystallin family)
VAEQDVTRLGDVLDGTSASRRDADEITTFDSTGLAIQDLAIARAAVAEAARLDLPTIEL